MLVNMHSYAMLNMTEGDKLVQLVNDLIEHPSVHQWDMALHQHICYLLAVRRCHTFH